MRIISVPKLNELSAMSLVEQVKKDSVIIKYLPEIKDHRSVNRQFLFNVSDNAL